ncbi:YqgE/AlgH family protein [Janibacter limosus]|uniref:YqgE/AlgH family protein n=1 Tax=Janibacter limosus TaxID=53458 RepID=UPI0035E20960|nr:YqgE/AlgH family protein [Janibacter limosus]
MDTSLAGRLLVATPDLTDDLFARSVVPVLQHDETTAEGVILNKPLDTSIDEVLPGWQAGSSLPQRVFRGGPVQLDSAIGLAGLPGDAEEPPGVKRLFGAISLVDSDSPQEIIWPRVSALRIFAGYAGWSADQLADERASGGWYVVDSEVGDIFDEDPATLWRRVLRRQSGTPGWVSTYPVDPDLN